MSRKEFLFMDELTIEVTNSLSMTTKTFII